MAAVADETISFRDMTEVQVRQWVEENPERVNDRDRHGYTPLYEVVCRIRSLPLTV